MRIREYKSIAYVTVPFENIPGVGSGVGSAMIQRELVLEEEEAE